MHKRLFKITCVLGLVLINAISHAGIKHQIHLHFVDRDSLLMKYRNDVAIEIELQNKKSKLTNKEYFVLHESSLRRMRTDGLKLWEAYPNDGESILWLQNTVTWAIPSYYNFSLNRFDTGEKAKWEQAYAKVRGEYMSYLEDKKDTAGKFRFQCNELSGDIAYNKFIFQITGKKFALLSYAAPIIHLLLNASSKNIILHDTAEQILRNPDEFGLDNAEIIDFLKMLKEANIPALNNWVDGKSRMFKLKQESLQLSFRSVDGNLVDIQQMKGKVILIDFWATWCSACLHYMPTVRDTYNKYHAQGFEVISVSVNKNAEKDQVLALEKKLGVSWPLGIIGDEKLKNAIWRKFAFTSVPQLILLDKNGRLIENNGRLENKDSLNELVKKALE